jgi:hypothetical protein
MYKTPRRRTVDLKVKFTFEDESKVMYCGEASVTINIGYEIEKVSILGLEAFDQNDLRVEPSMSLTLVNQFESIAGMKALEKIEAIDFVVESEE